MIYPALSYRHGSRQQPLHPQRAIDGSHVRSEPELVPLAVLVRRIKDEGGGGVGGSLHAQQHHTALDALFTFGGGEQRVDLRVFVCEDEKKVDV